MPCLGIWLGIWLGFGSGPPRTLKAASLAPPVGPDMHPGPVRDSRLRHGAVGKHRPREHESSLLLGSILPLVSQPFRRRVRWRPRHAPDASLRQSDPVHANLDLDLDPDPDPETGTGTGTGTGNREPEPEPEPEPECGTGNREWETRHPHCPWTLRPHVGPNAALAD